MKCFNSDCEQLQTNLTISITTVDLMTRLTIFDVDGEDFGMYKLTVTNGIGEEMIQEFHLLPEGKNMTAH